MINIWTIQLAQWRKLRDTDIELIDITAKSGTQEFAPDYNLVMMYKVGQMSEVEYTDRYVAKMRQSLRSHPEQWEQFKQKENVAFACYCQKGVFCHRHLFASMVNAYLTSEGYSSRLMGEVGDDQR